MNDTNTETTLDIAELEYDVGSVGALEPSDSQASYAAFILYADNGSK